MATFAGSLARTSDFGGTKERNPESTPRTRTRLAKRGGSPATAGSHVLPWRDADTYRVLEHRRRQAQMHARRLLALLDE